MGGGWAPPLQARYPESRHSLTLLPEHPPNPLQLPPSTTLLQYAPGNTDHPPWYLSSTGPRDLTLCVRGTLSVRDCLTDLNVGPSPSPSRGHEGMRSAALRIVEEALPALEDGVAGGKSLTITGHSLGAGVASLIHKELGEKGVRSRCFCYGPPCCVSGREGVGEGVVSVIRDGDPFRR